MELRPDALRTHVVEDTSRDNEGSLPGDKQERIHNRAKPDAAFLQERPALSAGQVHHRHMPEMRIRISPRRPVREVRGSTGSDLSHKAKLHHMQEVRHRIPRRKTFVSRPDKAPAAAEEMDTLQQ